METRGFAVRGMHCGGCEATLRKVVGFVEGVAETQADFKTGKVVVTYDPATATAEDIGRAIEDAGYELVG